MKKLIFTVTVFVVSTAWADTIYVDVNCSGPGNGSEADPYCSIQTAIDNAVDTDEIVVAAGTYFEVIDFRSKSITLRSSDGPDVTTIDAQQAGTVVTCWADAVLEGFTITGGHTAGGGGGILGSNMSVSHCRFLANHAVLQAGGVALWSGRQVFTNCIFEHNTSDYVGGGLWSFEADTTLVGCTFDGNVANYAGAIAPELGRAKAVGCTFSGNLSRAGGFGPFYLTGGYTAVTNCIVWGNSPNLIPDWMPISFSCVQGGFPGVGNIDANPMFVDPANSDFRLSPGSPCIDAGHNNAIAGLTDTDLNGDPRFADDPATRDTGCGIPVIVDMGSHEYQGVPGEIPLYADLNDDGTVTIADLFALGQCIGSGDPDCCIADLNADGAVGVTDSLLLMSRLVEGVPFGR